MKRLSTIELTILFLLLPIIIALVGSHTTISDVFQTAIVREHKTSITTMRTSRYIRELTKDMNDYYRIKRRNDERH